MHKQNDEFMQQHDKCISQVYNVKQEKNTNLFLVIFCIILTNESTVNCLKSKKKKIQRNVPTAKFMVCG